MSEITNIPSSTIFKTHPESYFKYIKQNNINHTEQTTFLFDQEIEVPLQIMATQKGFICEILSRRDFDKIGRLR